MDTEKTLALAGKGKRVHLIGIGGVSMCALAQVLFNNGASVTGSDIRSSAATAKLSAMGISISIGHAAENAAGADCVIRTAAVHEDNPEIQYARAHNIPLFERAEAWGAIMRGYEKALCIAGTHGKSTCTSMATHIAMRLNLDPTVMIGGDLPLMGGGHRVGNGKLIIAESCEYCNSFLHFFPTTAVILNVDEDHLDFFSGLEEIQASFRRFAELVPEDGYVIANGDDENTMDALKGIDRTVITFGFGKGCACRAEDVTQARGLHAFTLVFRGQALGRVALNVPGRHNILNALASAAAFLLEGAPFDAVREGLESYRGLRRRFELRGHLNGAPVYDDYAHHPTEVKALLKTARAMGFKRLFVVFQPHTYTRTKALLFDFVAALINADVLILPDIYAAREENTVGVTSADLCMLIPGALYMPDFDQIAKYLIKEVRADDAVFTVGAGDVTEIFDRVEKALKA